MTDLEKLYKYLVERKAFLDGVCERTEKALGRDSYSYGQADGQRFECEATLKDVGEMILKRIAETKEDDDKKSLVKMTLDDVAELCAGRHQECTDTTDWETECPFYDSEEKKCVLERRPFAWTTRINAIEDLEKLYKYKKEMK